MGGQLAAHQTHNALPIKLWRSRVGMSFAGIPAEHGRLSHQPPVRTHQVPNSTTDHKTPAELRNADTSVIPNETLAAHPLHHACPGITLLRFSAAARRHRSQLLPRHLKSLQSSPVPIVEDRIRFRSVRNNSKRRLPKQPACQPLLRRLNQFRARKTPPACTHQQRMRHVPTVRFVRSLQHHQSPSASRSTQQREEEWGTPPANIIDPSDPGSPSAPPP